MAHVNVGLTLFLLEGLRATDGVPEFDQALIGVLVELIWLTICN